MINGVLVERTVEDALPALRTNSDGLKKVLDELVKQYKRQQEEMERWKVSFIVDQWFNDFFHRAAASIRCSIA